MASGETTGKGGLSLGMIGREGKAAKRENLEEPGRVLGTTNTEYAAQGRRNVAVKRRKSGERLLRGQPKYGFLSQKTRRTFGKKP